MTRTTFGTAPAVSPARVLFSAVFTCPERVTTPLVELTETLVTVERPRSAAILSFTCAVIFISSTCASGDSLVRHATIAAIAKIPQNNHAYRAIRSFLPSECEQSSRHGVFEHANAFDLDFHNVAPLHCARRAWRSGVNHVARNQRHPAADPTHHRRAIENQIGRGLFLDYFAIQPCFEYQVAIVQARDDRRAQRSKGIRTLGAPPLQVLARAVLPVALADVVAAGDAEDRGARLLGRNDRQAFADDDHQFPLEVYVDGVCRNNDRLEGMQQGAHGFIEHLRTVRLLPVAEVALVISAHGQDLGRLARTQQLAGAERMARAAFLVRSKESSGNLPDDCALQNAIRGVGFLAVSNIFGQCCGGCRHADDDSIASQSAGR